MVFRAGFEVVIVLGRKHDKYGNFMQWWTNQTIESFENLTDCFVKQYENFTIPGVEGHVSYGINNPPCSSSSCSTSSIFYFN